MFTDDDDEEEMIKYRVCMLRLQSRVAGLQMRTCVGSEVVR